jgi:hypothetical protein
MAFDVLNVGTTVNDGTGDTLRAGGQKINANFAKAVEGPASATSGVIAAFDGTTGKLLQAGAGAGSFSSPSIRFAAETDAGFYRIGSRVLGYSSYGVEGLRIDDTVRVGLGVSSISYTLDVRTNPGGGNAARFRSVATSGANTVFISNNNDVGLKLETYGSAATTGTVLNVGANGAAIYGTGAAPLAIAATSGQPLLFGSGTSEHVRITSAGNVGIGTATPSTTLDVGGTGALKTPVGTDGQRPTPATGMLRFNTDSSSFEGYDGSAWGAIGGGGGTVAFDDANNILATQVFG